MAHIQYELDESIATSNFFSDPSVCDFSIVKDAWNGITDNIIIYGPNDTVPTGITPIVVTYTTFCVENNGYNNTFGFTKGINDGEECNANQNWDSVTISLNDSLTYEDWGDGYDAPVYTYRSPFAQYSGDEFQAEFNATIIHEFGHALKLSHPVNNHQIYNHEFEGNRGGVENSTYYSCMWESVNYSYPSWEKYIPTNYGAQIVTKYDKMNLVSKWEYHSQCY